MTTKTKLTPGKTITYRNPKNGGLYHATLVKLGRKWATVMDYWPAANPKRRRVPVGDVQLATSNCGDCLFERVDIVQLVEGVCPKCGADYTR